MDFIIFTTVQCLAIGVIAAGIKNRTGGKNKEVAFHIEFFDVYDFSRVGDANLFRGRLE